MSKKTKNTSPIEPGKTKKNSDLKIGIIAGIICIGLPLIMVIAILLFSFGMINKIIRIAIDQAHEQSYVVNLDTNNKVPETVSEAFNNIYDNIAYSSRTLDYVPDETLAKKRCRALEYYIEDKTDNRIDICDDWGFKAYAYYSNSYIFIELYGVDLDSDRYVKMKLNKDFTECYGITMDNVSSSHNAEAEILKYDEMRVKPSPSVVEPTNI